MRGALALAAPRRAPSAALGDGYRLPTVHITAASGWMITGIDQYGTNPIDNYFEDSQAPATDYVYREDMSGEDPEMRCEWDCGEPTDPDGSCNLNDTLCVRPLDTTHVALIDAALRQFNPATSALCHELRDTVVSMLAGDRIMLGSGSAPSNGYESPHDDALTDAGMAHVDEKYFTAVTNRTRSLGDLLGLLLHEAMHQIGNPDGTYRYTHPTTGAGIYSGPHNYSYPGTPFEQITQSVNGAAPCASPERRS